MLRDIDLVVWDFDGVFNANYNEEGYRWQKTIDADLSMDGPAFRHALFSPKFLAIMTGHVDLRDALEELLPTAGYSHGPDAFMEYWFSNDYFHNEGMDELLVDVRATGVKCVIGTNNEPYRAGYIKDQWGYGARVDTIYTSGLMKVAKPDHDFYQHIMDAEGLSDRARVLFIDDHPENIVSANEYGWRTHQFGDLKAKKLGTAVELRSLMRL